MIRTLRKLWRRWWRSSKTGRFVTEEYAETNPDTTEEQKRKRGPSQSDYHSGSA